MHFEYKNDHLKEAHFRYQHPMTIELNAINDEFCSYDTKSQDQSWEKGGEE